MTDQEFTSQLERKDKLKKKEIKEIYSHLKENHLEFYSSISDRTKVDNVLTLSLDYLRGM